MVVLRIQRAYVRGIKLSLHLSEPNFGVGRLEGREFKMPSGCDSSCCACCGVALVVPVPSSQDILLTSWSPMWVDSDQLAKYTVILQITQQVYNTLYMNILQCLRMFSECFMSVSYAWQKFRGHHICMSVCILHTHTHSHTHTHTHTHTGQEVANSATKIGKDRGEGITHNWEYLAAIFHHFLNQIKIHPDTLSCD